MKIHFYSCNITSMDIKDRIKEARVKAGLNQSELARALGVSPQTVQQWEAGDTSPRKKKVEAMKSILGVEPEWILFGQDAGKESRNRVDAPVDISALINVATPTYMETLKTLQQAQDAGVLEDSDKAMLKIIADKYKDRL